MEVVFVFGEDVVELEDGLGGGVRVWWVCGGGESAGTVAGYYCACGEGYAMVDSAAVECGEGEQDVVGVAVAWVEEVDFACAGRGVGVLGERVGGPPGERGTEEGVLGRGHCGLLGEGEVGRGITM